MDNCKHQVIGENTSLTLDWHCIGLNIHLFTFIRYAKKGSNSNTIVCTISWDKSKTKSTCQERLPKISYFENFVQPTLSRDENLNSPCNDRVWSIKAFKIL